MRGLFSFGIDSCEDKKAKDAVGDGCGLRAMFLCGCYEEGTMGEGNGILQGMSDKMRGQSCRLYSQYRLPGTP